MKAKVGVVICLIGIVVCVGVIIGMVIINNKNNNSTQISTEESNNVKNDNVVSDVNDKYNNVVSEVNDKDKAKITIQETIIDEGDKKEGEKKEYSCDKGDIINYEGMMYSNIEFIVVDVSDSSVTLKVQKAVKSDLYDMNGISTFDDNEEFVIKKDYPKTYASMTNFKSVSYVVTVEK